MPGLIEGFLLTSLAGRMQRAAQQSALHRETPFVIAVPGGQIDPSWGDQPVLVQGIIDAWFEEEGQIILLDYKTDRVPLGDGEYLARYYRVQMDCYRSALERLTGKC